jgi:hypothetical protein
MIPTGHLIDRCVSRHRDRNVGCVLQNEFPDFDADSADAEFTQKVGRQIVGQCFNKFGRLPGQKLFRLLTDRRIVDRSRDRVLDVPQVTHRPKSDIENKALPSGSFGVRNANSRKDFQLLDMNLLLGATSHFSKVLTSRRILF